MKKIIKTIMCALVLSVLTPIAAFGYDGEEKAPQVLMLGTFHFSNPQRDVIKTDVINVLDDESQAYLEALSQRIVDEFHPTMVLLEYNPENDEMVQQKYQDYLMGSYELEVNENYQLGFRVAKLAGGVPIASYDERSIGWNPVPMWDILESAAPEINALREQSIKELTEKIQISQTTLNLQELLKNHNTWEEDRLNMDFYLMTNSVASEGGFEGVEATSSWWKRNFAMYAKIQRQAKPNARLFVIGGQGHTAILKQLLEIDRRIDGVDIFPLL